MSQHPLFLASERGGGYEKAGSCHPNNLEKENFSTVLSKLMALKNEQTGEKDCFYLEAFSGIECLPRLLLVEN